MEKKTFSDFGIDIQAGESRAICPECTPSRKKKYIKDLAVDQDKGVWFCHHCGWCGGLGGDFDHKEVERHFTKPHFVETDLDPNALEWFNDRQISYQTIAMLKIQSGQAWMQGENGGGHVNTVQFPFYMNGEVVNVKYRTGDKRFRQEKNARKCLYNYDMAMRSNSDTLIITEGEMDVAALVECGIHAAVSVPDGAPSANTKNYTTKFDFLEGANELFDKFKRIVLYVDSDEPGRRLEEELSRRLGFDKCYRVEHPMGTKDANELLIVAGVGAVKKVIETAKPFPIDGVQTPDDIYHLLLDKREGRSVKHGEFIGWTNSEQWLNIELGQMTIVTGIPSHGKSTFIDALRVNMWKLHGWPSAAFSPENWPVEDHMSLLIEMAAEKNFYQADPSVFDEVFQMTRHGFYFIQPERDEDMMSVEAILERAKSLIYRYGVKMLVIDPWNEIDHTMKSGEREDQYISRQLAKIRRFARMNKIHVFVIAHPTKLEKDKNGAYPVPTPYDIAGGAMWRNKADIALCVHRPDMTNSQTDVYVQKVRYRRNGKVGKMSFIFHVDTSTYHPR